MSAASAKASKVHKIIALNEVGALKEVGPILGLVLVGSPKPIARPRRSAWASSIVAGWLRTTLAVRIDASVAHA